MMAIKNNKGSVLMAAAIFSFIVTLAGMAFLTFAITLHGQVSREIADTQSIYNYCAGAIGRAVSGARSPFDGLNNFSEFAYASSKSSHSSIGGPSQRGGGEIRPLHNERHESFADFLFLTNSERDPLRHDRIYWWTPDTLYGWIHSNDTIRFQDGGCPFILGRITSTLSLPSGCPWPPGSGYFPAIHFPDSAEALRYNSGYNWGTLGHDSLTQIVLSGSNIYMRKCGKVRVNGADKIHCDPSTIGASTIYSIPSTGAIFINGKVWVSAARGRIDRMDGAYPESSYSDGGFVSQGFSGKLTIGSSDTMIIADNLIYQHARPDNSVPTTMDSCSDILGLVSEGYVMVGRNSRDTTYINAGIAALTAFSVQDIYWEQSPGWDNEKDALYVWGSIAQYCRGLIHTQLPNNHLRGFVYKDYHYDVRFPENRPLAFPGVRERLRMQYISDQDGQI